MSYVTEQMKRFNVKRHQVEQEGSKQCAVVYLDDGCVFVSYNTIVGFTCKGDWYFTEEKHSVTTSCQVSAFSASRVYLPELVFDDAMAGNKDAVIADYFQKLMILEKQEDNFKEHYHNCMYNDDITAHLIALAKQLDNKQILRISKSVKADMIGALVDCQAGSDSKEKRYNKFKAKFNKALK